MPASRTALCRLMLTALSMLASAGATADVSVQRDPGADVRYRIVDLVNQARAQARRCGRERYGAAPPLEHSSLLDRAARQHAIDMVQNEFFEHEGSDGRQPKDRLADLGYRSRLTGENIAYGPRSAEEVVQGWLASPGHCANIMDPRFREIGVAFAVSDRLNRVYWVQDFARP